MSPCGGYGGQAVLQLQVPLPGCAGYRGTRQPGRSRKPQCLRMFSTTSGGSRHPMMAMIFISPAHLGQNSGSTSKTRLIRVARASECLRPYRGDVASVEYCAGGFPGVSQACAGDRTRYRCGTGNQCCVPGARSSTNN